MNGEMISIIIPVFNGEKYIERCIESVYAQTYTSYEIIVVNDGSTDKTGEILDRYIERGTKNLFIINQKNGGVSRARNVGTKLAHAKFLTYVDSDDRIHQDYLLKLYAAMKQDSADIVICGCNNVDLELGDVLYKDSPVQHIINAGGYKFFFWGVPWGNLYRTELIKKNNCRFSDGDLFEDDPFAMMIYSLSKKTVAIDYVGYDYMINNPNSSSKKSVSEFFPFSAYRLAFDTVENNNGNIEALKIYMLLKFFNLFFRAFRHARADNIYGITEYYYCFYSRYLLGKKNLYFRYLPLASRIKITFLLLLTRLHMIFPVAYLFTRV